MVEHGKPRCVDGAKLSMRLSMHACRQIAQDSSCIGLSLTAT